MGLFDRFKKKKEVQEEEETAVEEYIDINEAEICIC